MRTNVECNGIVSLVYLNMSLCVKNEKKTIPTVGTLVGIRERRGDYVNPTN